MPRLLRTTFGQVAANALLALGLWAVGAVTLHIVAGTGLSSPIWPSAGIAFGLVFQYGWRLLPGVVLGSLATGLHALVLGGTVASIAPALVIAALSGVEAILVAEIAHRRIGRHPSLVSPTQILWLLGVAAPLGTIAPALLAVLTLIVFHVVPLDAAARFGTTLWAADTLGIVVFGVITHMVLPEQRQIWHQRRAVVVLPSLAAVLVSMLLFLQGVALGAEHRDADLRILADSARHQVEMQLQQTHATLVGLRGLFDSSEHVNREEFHVYTRDLLDLQPTLLAVGWAPVVDDASLPAFIATERASRPDFQVTRFGPNGTLVPVTTSGRHVVMDFLEPELGNALAIGFDVASQQLGRAVIEAAITSGDAAGTAPIRLLQDADTSDGFLVLLPVFTGTETPVTRAAREASLRGFVAAVSRNSAMLNAALSGARWSNVSVTLTDVTSSLSKVRMATHASKTTGTPAPTQQRWIHAFGRTWRIDLTSVSQSSVEDLLVNEPAVMVSGVVIAIVLMAFLLLLSGMEREARREAELDPLTGLANRRGVLRGLERARREVQESDIPHVLLFLDLDRFKPVNDTAGHAIGDRLLCDIADILRSVVRDTDVVARIGGDEFAVILHDCSAEEGRTIAEAMVRRVQEHRVDVAAGSMGVGVSVGLTVILHPDPEDAETLLKMADDATYAAKFAGGGRVVEHGASPAEAAD